MSKKLEEKQRKRLAEHARQAQRKQAARRSNLLTVGIAGLVVVAVAALIISDRSAQEDLAAVPAGAAAQDAGCGDVESFDQVSREHIDIGSEHEDYNSNPPTSGPHYPTPADAAFYPDALPGEQLVHNLEHGQIVIWYRPDAPDETVDGIQALVEDANAKATAAGGAEPLLAAPYDQLDGEFDYAVSAWTQSQSCVDYSTEAINDFRREFQGRGPEGVGVPPAGG